MKEIVIDCGKISSREELLDILALELAFPKEYGRNLDAFHDVLTSICLETKITFLHFSTLPFPVAGLLRVLGDSEEENERLEISFVTN